MATGSVPASTARQDHERFIERQLDRTRRQVKMVELAAAGITLVVGVLVFFLVAALIDHWVLGLGTFGRFTLLATLVGGIAWYAWAVIWPLLRNSINPAYAALTIEHSTPTLKNSLINFLMLRSHRGDVHEVVYEAVGQRAATDLQHVPIDSVVDYSKLIKVGYALAAIFAVCAAYQILSPKDPLQTFARVAAPWADIARPSRVQIENVEPGDAEQYFGDQVTISAVIRGARSSDRMVLRYSTADGQIEDQAVELTPDDAHHRFTTQIPRDGQGLQQDITYRIEAGDAVTRDYTLTVVSAPTIVVEKLEYDFPAYTQKARETRERSGDIRALEGTRVTIHAKANTPIQAAYLEFDPVNDHAPEATLQRQRVTLQASGTSASGSFVLELQPDRVTPKFGTYQVTFVTARGQLGQHPALHTIDVIRDLPPEVEILAPRTQQVEVPENGEAVVEVRAVDPDYALSRVGLKLASGGRELADKALLSGPSQAGQAVTKFHFRPSEFKLRAGDEIAYWATAADNRTSPQNSVADPNTARTSNQFFKIVPADPNAKPPANPDQQGQPQADRPPMGNDNPPDQPPQGEKGAPDQRNQADQGRDPNQQPMNEQGTDEGGSDGNQSEQKKPNEKNSSSEPNDQPRDQGDMGKSPNDQSQGGGAGDDQQAKDKPMPNENQGKNESGMGGGTNAGENEGEGNAAEQPQEGGKQPKGANQAGGSSDEQNKTTPQDQGAGGKDQGGAGTGQGARDPGQPKGAEGNDPNAKPDNSQGGASGANESGERPPLHEGEAFEKALERMLEKARQEQGKTPQGEAGRDTQQQPSQDDIDKLPQHLKDRLQELLKKQQQQQQQPQDGASGQQQSQPGVKGDGNQTPPQNPPGPTGENQPGEGASGEQSQPAGADKKQGTGANNERSQGGAGQQEGGDNVKPEKNSSTGEPQTEGERQGGMGQNGEAGAGRANEDNKGSVQAQEAGRDKPKSMQSDNKQPGQGNEAQSPSGSKRQSDSQGDEGGDRSGGGEQGGGQRANAAGNDSAGSNSAADEGAGAANQSGMGETAASAGDKQKAAGQTGQAGNEAGNGSTTQKDPRGDRPGRANQPNAGEQAPMQNKQPQPTGRDDREGTGQTGDFVTGGGKPSEQHGKSRFADAEGPAAEKARLDYAREATDLVLEYLKDQKDQPDQELLDDLGWTSEDLKQFLAKWEAAKRDAAVNPGGQRELDEALRSLGLRPSQDKLRRGETRSDNVRGLGDVGPTSGPPSKYLEQFRAFKKGAARGK